MHCHRSDYLPTKQASHRLSYDLCRGLVQRPRDAHIEAMCGWSMSLTRFGVAKLRAAVRAMPKQYDGARIHMATRCRITSLPGTPQKTNCVSPRYWADSRYIQDITARPGLLSVTESVALPPQPKGGHMSKLPAFDLREWLVPPVLMPIFLVLLVAAAMVIQW